uniref:Protein-tyrosine phosphatase n=1 Tax=Haemonchus placei TaxID=6290 RepID=A0A0N4WUW9_HAEPC
LTFQDVGCLDATRVKLDYYGGDDYIHANYVGTPTSSRRFICTQAPLEKTCKEFWFMCMQDRVEFIVMLCNFIEKGAKKCYQYFPLSGSMTFGEITVAFAGSTMMRFTCPTNAQVRITTLIVERNGRKMRTRHLHWIDWPDRGVPPADTAIVQVLELIKGTQAPIVVHCSAGVGRTGSMVLIQYILESISMGGPLEETDKVLLKIRAQRANTIQASQLISYSDQFQTDQQYLFVHQVLLNYFVENQLLDPRWKPFLNRFTVEYNRSVF